MPNPALTVGGTPLYPTGGLLDPSRPVYRPNDGSAGLLTQPNMDNLINNFAGGILNKENVAVIGIDDVEAGEIDWHPGPRKSVASNQVIGRQWSRD